MAKKTKSQPSVDRNSEEYKQQLIKKASKCTRKSMAQFRSFVLGGGLNDFGKVAAEIAAKSTAPQPEGATPSECRDVRSQQEDRAKEPQRKSNAKPATIPPHTCGSCRFFWRHGITTKQGQRGSCLIRTGGQLTSLDFYETEPKKFHVNSCGHWKDEKTAKPQTKIPLFNLKTQKLERFISFEELKGMEGRTV